MANHQPQRPGIFEQAVSALNQRFGSYKDGGRNGGTPPVTTIQFHATSEKEAFAVASTLSMAYVMLRRETKGLEDVDFEGMGTIETRSIKPATLRWNAEKETATVSFPFQEFGLGGSAFALSMRTMVSAIQDALFGEGKEHIFAMNLTDDKGNSAAYQVVPVNSPQIANGYYKMLYAMDMAIGPGKSGSEGLYAVEKFGVKQRQPDGKEIPMHVPALVIDTALYDVLASNEVAKTKKL